MARRPVPLSRPWQWLVPRRERHRNFRFATSLSSPLDALANEFFGVEGEPRSSLSRLFDGRRNPLKAVPETMLLECGLWTRHPVISMLLNTSKRFLK
jgi:hypothetical protein